MSTGQPEGQSASVSADDLRDDIERTRQQLGETVEALAAKADVKAQARQKAGELREQAASRASQLRQTDPAVLAAAGAAVVLTVIAIVLWRRG